MRKLLFSCISILSLSQAISDDINWTFPSTLLSTSNANASDPQIASDANGNLVAAWIENGSVISKTKLMHMSWDTASVLSTSSAVAPRIVCDPYGNATAVWLENGIVKTAFKPLMGNWSTTTALSDSGAGSPRIVTNSTGDIVAAWPRHGNIETKTKMFGQLWGGVQTINSSNAANQQVAISGTGTNSTAVIVWQKSNGHTSSVSASTKPIVQNWTPEQPISNTQNNAGFPNIAMDSNGNATAVWFYYELEGSNYNNVIVQSAERPSNGTWSTPVALSSPGIRNPSTLTAQVGYDNFGNAIALWNTSFDDETFNIETAIKPLTGNWSSSVDILKSNLFGLHANLKVNSIGEALALYMFYNGNTLNIQSTESDITGFMNNHWSVPLSVSTGTENAYPKVASTVVGNVINAAAIWLSNNGVNNQILATTGSKSLPLPPTHLQVSQNVSDLGVYQDYYNTLSWSPSSDPSVVGYLIYRNGLFLAQVSENVLQFIDHNRVQNGTVQYGVASVDDQNTHSSIMTVNFP